MIIHLYRGLLNRKVIRLLNSVAKEMWRSHHQQVDLLLSYSCWCWLHLPLTVVDGGTILNRPSLGYVHCNGFDSVSWLDPHDLYCMFSSLLYDRPSVYRVCREVPSCQEAWSVNTRTPLVVHKPFHSSHLSTIQKNCVIFSPFVLLLFYRLLDSSLNCHALVRLHNP